MIAFGVPIRSEERFARYAAPTLERFAEPDSVVLLKRGYDSIQQPYNEILEAVSERGDLEAVVLLHEDALIEESRLLELIRWHLRDPRLGVIGAVGAEGVSSSAWWNSSLLGSTWSPLFATDRQVHSSGPRLADAVDGYLMIVSARAARAVRFDQAGARDFHGYDVDFCFRVRARGLRVVVDDIASSHWSDGGDPGTLGFSRASQRWQQTWNPRHWPREWRGSAPYGFFS